MLNHYTRRLVRRPFTLIALLACLTLVTPPGPALASGYQLSGTVYYFGSSSGLVVSPDITIYKWNGSSWTYHGVAYADECGAFTYDAGGPGTYMGSVGGYFNVTESPWMCGATRYDPRYVYGYTTAEAEEGAYVEMYILTT
jgi:hypothetical protein